MALTMSPPARSPAYLLVLPFRFQLPMLLEPEPLPHPMLLEASGCSGRAPAVTHSITTKPRQRGRAQMEPVAGFSVLQLPGWPASHLGRRLPCRRGAAGKAWSCSWVSCSNCSVGNRPSRAARAARHWSQCPLHHTNVNRCYRSTVAAQPLTVKVPAWAKPWLWQNLLPAARRCLVVGGKCRM